MASNTAAEQQINPNWSVFAPALVAILQAAEKDGANQQRLLRDSGLQQSQLSIPERRFPVVNYYKLYQLAAEASGNPDIGLSVGRIIYLKGLNLQLYTCSLCKSFRDYLNLIPSTLKMRGDMGETTAHREGNLVELRWEPLLKSSGLKRFCSDEVLSASAAIINSLCVRPVPVVKANFSYSQPKDTIQLEAIFGRNIAYNQPYSSLFFDSGALDFQLLKQDYQQGPDLTKPFSELFENDQAIDEFLANLKSFMMRRLPEGEVSIDKLASLMNISRRTLQRRLSDRGTNFLQVLQEVRSRMALRYLSDNRLGITEIAFLLGYADQGSFSSAFKSWHGMSPRDYRRK
ncbi:transcriptional regulator, AraC family protein [marine gamma proteobacterium HTCC2207]|jgi:AraC-like DNA-binding protein|uniref:Transcriptional regulator, AraC family protein n=1 Tax=gamma proteobacterium HTCC2207 TaxID=314287 RepID=Q1YPI7_9GAMM|nr:transcriptional regulator, AraC family protein [marine gamma proteobacterium HTCC2207] [gamma proteobacterium HTCC2207]